ncbi:MAG TPA: CHASE3 domain-containing protein [Steroidobacteraceae bacterium]|jgi:signal transduction histidine kinase|nr:CHASE3 domain-containing protein [Steroidobacteraceae bacterium]
MSVDRRNLLSEALDGLGRWYVAIPPFLIISFLAALFFVNSEGQERLQGAGERLQKSAAREDAIDALQNSLARSVGAQRGFLLTADPRYIDAYKRAVAEVEPRLEQLGLAYAGSDAGLRQIRDLHVLIGTRLADLSLIVAIQQTQGVPAAVALVKTSVGADTGVKVDAILNELRDREAAEHQAAGTHWAGSLTLSRWITLCGTIFNMLLVGIASRLVWLDMRRRTALTAELRDQKLQLERQVEDRTRELVELSTHLQNVAEREKASLARELHDELGGLLVGARMDISWAEQHLAKNDADLKQRLNRVQQNLSAGVDLKRRIIEELRPTLLDNVGLFAALRWQMKETCGNAGLKCIESYPDEEPRFRSEASIALFRIAQEAFSNILKHSAAKTADISFDMDDETLLMRIADDGIGIPAEQFMAIASHGLASMRHRVRALGGRLDVRSPASGGTMLIVQIPIANALAHVGEPQAT